MVVLTPLAAATVPFAGLTIVTEVAYAAGATPLHEGHTTGP